MHGDLRYWPVPELVALDLPGGTGFVDALRAIWDTGDAAAPLDPRLPAGAATASCSTRCGRPGSWRSDGEQHTLSGGRSASRRATRSSSPPPGRRGQPKGVVLTHEAVAASAGATSERLGVDPSHDIPGWPASPWRTSAGLSVVTTFHPHGDTAGRPAGFRRRRASRSSGRSGRVTHVSLGRDRAATPRPVCLHLRAARREQAAGESATATSSRPMA